MRIAAVVASFLMGSTGLFQLALAAGAPWGAAAWGGRHEGRLPVGLRVASGVAGLVVYPYLILLVLASAGIGGLEIPGSGQLAMWVLCGLFVVGTILNAASPSRPERAWAGVSAALAVCCGLVALGM